MYHIYFHTKLDIFEKRQSNLPEWFIFLFDQIKHLGEIGYGLLHAMSQDKLPSLYFRGFENNLLTIEEKEKLWLVNFQITVHMSSFHET